MERINRVKGWLDFANKDISCAKHLLGMRPVPLEIVCYHSEQAAEEALKGYLLYQNIEPSQTQDLGKLCSMCLKFDKAFEELMGPWERLARYGEPVYPSEMQISDNDMKTAIADADRVMAFVLQRLQLAEEIAQNDDEQKEQQKNAPGQQLT
jgi:HEPN domain-containing protein